MVKKVSFSNQHQDMAIIESHHLDVTEATKHYFKPASGQFIQRFMGYSPQELARELEGHLKELEHTSSLSILSAIEAAFRIDYLQRCYQKKKDDLSREFREIHKTKGSKASLEEDILEKWKEKTSVPKEIIGHLKGALKYRHWLAHGRYWEPKLGRSKYDFQGIHQLGQIVFTSFPLEGLGS